MKLAWIVNDSARKAAFRKRRASLFKKMSELTVLCDVNGFIMVYGLDSDEPTMWPERTVVEELIARFQSIPDLERWKKMTNQETFLKEKATKVQDQIKKIQEKNNEMEMNETLYQINQNGKPLHTFQARELTDLVLFMKERMKETEKQIESKEIDLNVPPFAPHPPDNGETESMSIPDGGNPTESLFNYLRREKTKQMENITGAGSSVRSDMGLPDYTYFGSSVNAANEMGCPSVNFEGNYDMRFSGVNTRGTNHDGSYLGMSQVNYGSDIGNPQVNYEGNITGGSEMVAHYYGSNIASSSGNPIGSDIGLRPRLFGGNNGGSEAGMPLRQFGGSSGGSDGGLPYDVSKPWKHPCSP